MNIKEIEKYKIRDYYMIPVEVVDNMFYLFEQQYRKQKEVIDKAIEYINKNLIVVSILDGVKTFGLNSYTFDYKKLLDILNEVSE